MKKQIRNHFKFIITLMVAMFTVCFVGAFGFESDKSPQNTEQVVQQPQQQPVAGVVKTPTNRQHNHKYYTHKYISENYQQLPSAFYSADEFLDETANVIDKFGLTFYKYNNSYCLYQEIYAVPDVNF